MDMDVNERLLQAVSTSDVSYEDVKLLLSEGADPCFEDGSSKRSALFTAIERGDENLLHLLLGHSDRGSVVTTRNTQELDALMLAASLGHNGCVNLLLASGFGSPELINRTDEGNTALMLACTEGHTQVARTLLENGADPNVCDGQGFSAVHVASVQGNLPLLQELRQCGARFAGAVDHRGNTPMHFCAHPYVLEYLYYEGVSPNARNHQGSTPLDVQRRMNAQPQTVSLLQRLQEDERRRKEAARLGSGRRLLLRLRWLASDVTSDMGWKVVMVIVVVLFVLAWQLTVSLHGQSPFGPYPYTG